MLLALKIHGVATKKSNDAVAFHLNLVDALSIKHNEPSLLDRLLQILKALFESTGLEISPLSA